MLLIARWFKQRTSRKILGLVLGAIALVIALRLLSDLPTPPETATSFKPLTTIPPTAQQVQVGFYGLNVYTLDIASNSYYLDAYVWFRWKGQIDPIADLEFTNAVEEWGMTQKPGYEKPQPQADGSLYQILRVEGRFVQPFNMARYPLDQQRISMVIENSIHTAKDLVYLADTKDSGYANTIAIQGWSINGWKSHNLLHTYPSNFGFAEPDVFPYSSVRFDILINRPLNFFIWKLLLPLLIVLMSGWGALLLHPSYVESRIAIPVTALLTIVFLQQSYSSALPEVGYLVLLDKIYALAYLLIIATIMEAIVTADWAKDSTPDTHRRIIRLDRPFLAVQAMILIVGVSFLIST
ncbi:MAG: hypothetical protein NW220_03955 [Leptolyngbyaceae cyanobacterium bins.349]|nr:hypothetical protein [Leptolyngbyaceae cyanobacterium bins.349]